jgi:hypothetical protein
MTLTYAERRFDITFSAEKEVKGKIIVFSNVSATLLKTLGRRKP